MCVPSKGHWPTLRAGVALAALAVLLVAAPIWAGDLNRALALDIPAQSLANALTALASQADLQILVPQELVAGKRSLAVRGHYSGLQALQRILTGTALDYAVSGRDTVIVHAQSPSVARQPSVAKSDGPAGKRTAQTGNAMPLEGDSPATQEILVTAQKRTERLQDVPLAVTAVSAEELAHRQIKNTESLVQMVPALNYQQGNNPTNTTFRIRGVGTALFGQGTESSVSLVVDGVVQARQAQSFADLVDVERVEVLEGPQGTLFGKNASGGVINVITAQPSPVFAASTDVMLASENEYRLQGSLTGPVNDQLAYRLSTYYYNVGGWIHDIATDTDRGGSRNHGMRGKLSWDPVDELNLLFAADYQDNYRDCCHPIPVRLINPTLIALYRPLSVTLDNTSNAENAHSDSWSEQLTTSVRATYDAGIGELTSISAFQSFHLHNNVDADGLNTPQPIFVGLQTPNYGQFDLNGGSVNLGNFTQEVRLASKDSDRSTYVTGLFYSTLILNRPFQYRRAICPSGILGQPCPGPIYQSAADNTHLASNSLAAFGQAEYPLIGNLKLIAGLREQRDRNLSRGITYTPSRPGDSPYPGYTTVSGGAGYTNIATSGKAGLQYTFSRNSQAYATYTRGYKGEGVMMEISSDWNNLAPLLPETVNAYEAGYKARLFDDRLVIGADVFLARYYNLQVQANHTDYTTGTNNFVPTNVGASVTRGMEFQLTLRPTEQFSLNVSMIFDEATFDMNGLDCPLEFQAAVPVIAPGEPMPINSCYNPQVRNSTGAVINSGPVQNVRGASLPAAPRWRGMLSPRYDRALKGNVYGFVQVDVTSQSQVQMALDQDPLLVQPAYTLTNLTVGVRPADGRYQVSFFVKNVLNQRYFTTLTHGSDLVGVANPYDVFAWRPKDASRYVGAALTARF